MRNPLNIEISLSGLTVIVRDAKAEGLSADPDFINVEVIDDFILGARDSRTVSPDIRNGCLHFSQGVVDTDCCEMLSPCGSCCHAHQIRLSISPSCHRIIGRTRPPSPRYSLSAAKQGVCTRYSAESGCRRLRLQTAV